jgi:hypothetical protein
MKIVGRRSGVVNTHDVSLSAFFPEADYTWLKYRAYTKEWCGFNSEYY